MTLIVGFLITVLVVAFIIAAGLAYHNGKDAKFWKESSAFWTGAKHRCQGELDRLKASFGTLKDNFDSVYNSRLHWQETCKELAAKVDAAALAKEQLISEIAASVTRFNNQKIES